MNLLYKIAYWDALHKMNEGKAMPSGVFFIIMLAMIPMEFHEEILSAQNKVKSLKSDAVAKLVQNRKEKGEREEKENEIIPGKGASNDEFGDDDIMSQQKSTNSEKKSATSEKKSAVSKKPTKCESEAEEDGDELGDAF